MSAPVARSLTHAPEIIQKLDVYIDKCISVNIGTVPLSDVQADLDIGVQRKHVPFPTADPVFRRAVDARLSHRDTYDCAEWSSNEELQKGSENSREQAEIRVEEIAGNLSIPLQDHAKIVCRIQKMYFNKGVLVGRTYHTREPLLISHPDYWHSQPGLAFMPCEKIVDKYPQSSVNNESLVQFSALLSDPTLDANDDAPQILVSELATLHFLYDHLFFHRLYRPDIKVRIHTFSVTHRRVLDAVLDGEKLSVFMTQIDEMPTVIDRFIENVLYAIICPDVIGVKPEAPLKAELPIRIAGSTSSTLEFDSVLNLFDEENGSGGSFGTTIDSSTHEYDHNGDTDDTDAA